MARLPSHELDSSTSPVDDFVQARVPPDLQPIVTSLRALMRQCAPQAQEIITYGIPAYRVRRVVAVINPTKKDITFSFSRGAEFVDRHGLLKGVGKLSKHVKLKSLSDLDRPALSDYIRQALALDAK
jgi:hypothetical protein